MKKKDLKISKRLEEIQNEIYVKNGDALILYANDHEQDIWMGCSLSETGDLTTLLSFFLERQPQFIHDVLVACAIATDGEPDCDGDCDNCDLKDDCDENEDSINPRLN